MQVLFLWDVNASEDTDLARHAMGSAADDPSLVAASLEMAQGAWRQRGTIDERVERLAPQWPPRRQPAVDRSLIRLAIWEMTNMTTPLKVVIDEAIELAKEFSTENSAAFVNGVLDAVLKEQSAVEPPATSVE